MRYYIYNHHDFWQWGIPDNELMESEVVFMWADFPPRNEVKTLQSMGKKVIVYEHGFGALFDYELNNREPIADGYLVLGQEKYYLSKLAVAKILRHNNKSGQQFTQGTTSKGEGTSSM